MKMKTCTACQYDYGETTVAYSVISKYVICATYLFMLRVAFMSFPKKERSSFIWQTTYLVKSSLTTKVIIMLFLTTRSCKKLNLLAFYTWQLYSSLMAKFMTMPCYDTPRKRWFQIA